MTAQRWPEDVGSGAEEAGRLLESLRRAGADAAAAAASASAPPGRHARPESPDPDPVEAPAFQAPRTPRAESGGSTAFTCDDPVCQWCPVCRASALVRQLSPETLSGLAELAGFAATVLADLARARAREAAPTEPGDE